MIRKLLLALVLGALLFGLLRNLVADPRSGAAGLLVLATVVYLAWRAAPAVRADVGRLRPRHGGGNRRRHRGESTF